MGFARRAAAYAGKGIARADTPPKVDGIAKFGIDARQPGQLYAAIRHSPRLGGSLRKATLPEGLPGVRGFVEGADYFAVVATGYAKAAAALEKATIVWNDDKALSVSTKDVFAAYRAALDQGTAFKPRWVIDSAGDAGVASSFSQRAAVSLARIPTTGTPTGAVALDDKDPLAHLALAWALTFARTKPRSRAFEPLTHVTPYVEDILARLMAVKRRNAFLRRTVIAYSEVARPKRFELLTPGFLAWDEGQSPLRGRPKGSV